MFHAICIGPVGVPKLISPKTNISGAHIHSNIYAKKMRVHIHIPSIPPSARPSVRPSFPPIPPSYTHTYTTLHCVTLHYVTLCYITLHQHRPQTAAAVKRQREIKKKSSQPSIQTCHRRGDKGRRRETKGTLHTPLFLSMDDTQGQPALQGWQATKLKSTANEAAFTCLQAAHAAPCQNKI